MQSSPLPILFHQEVLMRRLRNCASPAWISRYTVEVPCIVVEWLSGIHLVVLAVIITVYCRGIWATWNQCQRTCVFVFTVLLFALMCKLTQSYKIAFHTSFR